MTKCFVLHTRLHTTPQNGFQRCQGNYTVKQIIKEHNKRRKVKEKWAQAHTHTHTHKLKFESRCAPTERVVEQAASPTQIAVSTACISALYIDFHA